MSEVLRAVYDDLLLDHIRSARNYGLDGAAQDAVAIDNPLCGDTLRLELHWQAGALTRVRFECECCGIAMGNASLMTGLVEGASRETVRTLIDRALAVLRGDAAAASGGDPPVWQLLHEIAHRLPARRTCASLSWQALAAALDGLTHTIAEEIR